MDIKLFFELIKNLKECVNITTTKNSFDQIVVFFQIALEISKFDVKEFPVNEQYQSPPKKKFVLSRKKRKEFEAKKFEFEQKKAELNNAICWHDKFIETITKSTKTSNGLRFVDEYNISNNEIFIKVKATNEINKESIIIGSKLDDYQEHSITSLESQKEKEELKYEIERLKYVLYLFIINSAGTSYIQFPINSKFFNV